eukprot:14577100-Alexandrium_andersonii.AAC.1
MMFASLYKNYPDMFKTRLLGGSVDNIKAFWKSQVKHPALPGHPLLRKANYQERCVPLGLHGDSVP